MSLAAGGLAFSPFLAQLKAEAAGDVAKLPKRFVFVTRSNGLRTYGIAPKGLEGLVPGPVVGDGEAPRKLVTHDLTKYALNESMAGLEPFKDRMTIVNGLSAKVISSNHGAGFGAMGSYNAEKVPIAETIDGALANTHPGVFKHLGFKVDTDTDAKIDRPHVTAFGAKKPGSFYCDPAMAYGQLFGSIATDKHVKAKQLGDKNLLDFLIDDTKRVKAGLNSTEKEKLDHYLGAFESLADRRVKLAGMTDVLDKHAPEFADKYSSEVEVHRLEAHFDMAAASLIAGLTNVVTIRTDTLGLHYNGLGLGAWTVHDIGHIEKPGGHNKLADQKAKEDTQGITGVEARRRIRTTHFDQVGALARKLDAVPEGDGTMLDNTLIVVLSDHGSLHHPSFDEFPFVTIGNVSGALKTGQYLHYPNTKYSDNRTAGSFYSALMHAAGAPRDGFGQLDPRLPANEQKAPLAELLA
ncbi:MAG: DUF1552 domain-containing protein [Phycisphaeraceae bacterium]|nr:DUF1552 domain-containing protein [Phycisphaeraceae bacterium]